MSNLKRYSFYKDEKCDCDHIVRPHSFGEFVRFEDAMEAIQQLTAVKGDNMSGGHFNYDQNRIIDIVDGIERILSKNNKKDEYGYCYGFSESTINEFKTAIDVLKKAQIYAQRIDWFVSGDDGEESFHERLKEDLKTLTK